MAAKKPVPGKQTVAGFRRGANCDVCRKPIGGLLIALPPGPAPGSKETCVFCGAEVDVSRGYAPLEVAPEILILETEYPPLLDGRRWVEAGNRLCLQLGDERPKAVFRLPFRPVYGAIVEEETRYLVEYGHSRFVGTGSEILRRLGRDSWICKPALATEGLAELLASCRIVSGSATLGGQVAEDGRLVVPDAFFPSQRGAQAAWMKRLERWIKHQATPEEIAAYPHFVEAGSFLPHEVLPAMGNAALAGWANAARRNGIVVPFNYLVSRKRRTGKSSVAKAFCDSLWGTQHQSADALESPFRIAAYLEAGGAWNFNELEAADWSELGPIFKSAAESATFTSRGNGDQGLVEYLSRGVLVLTAQRLEAQQAPVLDRLFVSRFNENREPTIVQLQALERAQEALLPCGPFLTRKFAEYWGPNWQNVRANLEQIAADLEGLCGGALGGRRALSWAWIYLGLLTIQRATQQGPAAFGWVAPTIEDFCRQVVDPVEQAGKDLDRSPLDAFHSWLQRYRVNKIVGHGEEQSTKGQGILFEPAECAGYHGLRITKPVLDDYNKDHRLEPALQFADLRELQEFVEKAYQIPHADLFEESGRVKRHTIGGEQKASAFIPTAEEKRQPLKNHVLLSIDHANRRD